VVTGNNSGIPFIGAAQNSTGVEGSLQIVTANTPRIHIANTGLVGIGTTSPSESLEVAGNIHVSGADRSIFNRSNNALTFGTNNTERARIDSSGRLLVGTSTALETKNQGNNATTPSQQVAANTIAGSSQGLFFYGTGGTARGNLIFSRSNSATVGSHTVIGGSAHMGGLIFTGSDGTSFVPGAEIFAASDGTPGTDDMPGRLVFSTTAAGASSPTERARLTNTGALLVGTTATPTGASSGAVVAQDRVVISSTGAGRHQTLAGSTGSVTATPGTVVFKFKYTGGASHQACLVKLSISQRANNGTVTNSPHAEYAFQLFIGSTGGMSLNGAATVFEFAYVRATHLAFADLGENECTVTLTNPTGLALTGGAYKVEILAHTGAWTLDSVTAT
jgi:hypothetical protein